MTAVAAPVVTQPGVYALTPEQYHLDPVRGGSLSVSGARKLLPPSVPALFKYDREHRSSRPLNPVFNLGHGAHRVVLGAGSDLELIDAADYHTKAAQHTRDAAYAEGRIPVLPREMEQIQAMHAAVRENPTAAALFDPERGRPEQCLFWIDPETGVMRRAMLDWLQNTIPGRRVIVGDYKTADQVDKASVEKSMVNYGYGMQAPWYLDGVEALGLSPDYEPAFVFVFQMKKPPYLVATYQPDPDVLYWGRLQNRKAIALYQACVVDGYWPDYADNGVISVGLPGWAKWALRNGEYDDTEGNGA